MARGVNKAIIVGTLGRDPEVKYTAGGSAVVNVNVATNESWKDKSTGENVEKTEWHRIVIFGKLAEICGQYLSKGRQVYIEGRLQTRSWEDQQGQKRYMTEVVAQDMMMLGSRGDGSGGGGGGGGRSESYGGRPPSREAQQVASPPADAPDSGPSGGDFFDDDNDLPF